MVQGGSSLRVLWAVCGLVAVILHAAHSQSASGQYFVYQWTESATGCDPANATSAWDLYTNGSCEPQPTESTEIRGILRFCAADGTPMMANCSDSRCATGSCGQPAPSPACVEKRGRVSCRAMVTKAEAGSRTFTTSFYEFEAGLTAEQKQRCKTSWYNKYIRPADGECHLDAEGSFRMSCGRSGQVTRNDFSDLECKNQVGEEGHTYWPRT